MATTVTNPLVLISPTIQGNTLFVDSSVLPLTFRAEATCEVLEIVHSSGLLVVETYEVSGAYHLFSATVPVSGDFTLVATGRSSKTGVASNDLIMTPAFSLSITQAKTPDTPVVNPPSGVRIHRGRDVCRIEWVKSEDVNSLGTRVLFSTDPSGINVAYRQFGGMVTQESRLEQVPITSAKHVTETEGMRTTTLVESVIATHYSQVEISSADVGNADEFFVLLSSVVYDPDTNMMYESAFNGPFRCGFVDLRKASPADFPYLQNKEDIAGRMIAEMLRVYPDLDLTPRSELRDLFVDPVSLELAEQSIRWWFERCSDSISAMVQLDDADGDGFSDPFESSAAKQQLARAWHFDAATTQALIDKQFDLIGERIGLPRGGSLPAITELTVYTYSKPQGRVSIEAGAVIATVPDSETPSVQFITVGSAILDPNNLSASYDAAKGWWFVTVPAQCDQSGSIGNVGANTIRQPINGIPSGFFVTNFSSADYGQDTESNARYAERLQDRQVTGVDSGTRKGYLGTARAVPGVTEARVVASGDLEMLRDWDHERRKHVFGTVDIYVRGLSLGQEDTTLAYTYPNFAEPGSFQAYLDLTRTSATPTSLHFDPTQLDGRAVSVLEVVVASTAAAGSVAYYLGVNGAVLDPERGLIHLDPNEEAYRIVGTDVTAHREPVLLAGSSTPATNAQVLNFARNASLRCNLRTEAPLSVVPSLQPVVSVVSVTSDSAVPASDIRLIRTQDPLLLGGSDQSTDEVRVDFNTTSVLSKSLLFLSGVDQLHIDEAMVLDVFPDGTVGDVLSVRSEDKMTLYSYGKDYALKADAPYGSFSLVRLPGSTIPVADPDEDPTGKHILVSYNHKTDFEKITLHEEEEVFLNGTSPSYLANQGFIYNIWLPESYGLTTLSQDGYNTDPRLASGLYAAQVPTAKRYIKVTLDGVVMREGADFDLTVEPGTGLAAISRKMTGLIPDGGAVKVTYFTSGVFTIRTSYPRFVQQVSTAIESTRHAAADVVIKAMTENRVDMTLTVELEPNASADVVDSKIRTIITQVLDQVRDKLTQSEVIRQVKTISGVNNVVVPLTKFAKADGSYDNGLLIPTGTKWTAITDVAKIIAKIPSFPAKTFISTSTLLTNRTIPSGGKRDAYVGFLYEGFSFARTFSLVELSKATVPSFYIIGYGDTIDGSSPFLSEDFGKIIINLPNSGTLADEEMTNPSHYPFRVTYQVWGEDGYKDIQIGPSEYLRPGRIVIDYLTPKKGLIL
jgi:hypothetical protein